MHPILFRFPFGDLALHGYGLMMALAFLAGIFWVKREALRKGQDPAKALDLVFYAIIAGVLGSRLLHLAIADRDRFFSNPLILFKVWEGGLVFYGGLIGAMIVSFWFFRRHRLPALVYCDIFIPAVSFGHALGRLGCFMSGCCYGRPTTGSPWYAVIFPNNPDSFAPPGIPLYPTQLMESGAEFVTFCILLLIRRKQRFDGQLLASYLMIYAVVRGFVEYFRGDVVRGFVIDPWLSTSQGISVIMFFVGIAFYMKGSRCAAHSS